MAKKKVIAAPRPTVDERLYESFRTIEKCEAIIGNIERKGGRVPDSLAKEYLFAQIAYAVAKDDRSDPYYQGD